MRHQDTQLDQLLDEILPPTELLDGRRQAELMALAAQAAQAQANFPEPGPPPRHRTPRRVWRRPAFALAASLVLLVLAAVVLSLAAPDGLGWLSATNEAPAHHPLEGFQHKTHTTEGPWDKWIIVEPGTFTMGSPEDEPGHRGDEAQVEVEITRAFAIQATEVTQGQWIEVMGTDFFVYRFSKEPVYDPAMPADLINWYSAVAYTNRLSEREGLEACYDLKACKTTESTHAPGGYFSCEAVRFSGLDCEGYRLPTEAEWEYAARAGSKAPVHQHYPKAAWTNYNARGSSHPVAQKAPNPWGLYDTLGNVSEWVHDGYGAYKGGRDPQGEQGSKRRVLRGGAFRFVGESLDPNEWRHATRTPREPTFRMWTLGFRPVRTLR